MRPRFVVTETSLFAGKKTASNKSETWVDRFMVLATRGLPGLVDRRIAALSAAAAGLVFAVTATMVSAGLPHEDQWIALAMHVGGVPSMVIGAVVWLRAPSPRIGQLMIAVGASYYLMDLRASDDPLVFAVGFCLAYLWPAVLVHLVLVLPTGHPVGRLPRILIPVCYLAAVGTQVGRYLADHPEPPWAYDIPHHNTAWAKFSSLVVVVLSLVVTGVVVRRWWTSPGVRRRPFGPLWAAAIVSAAVGIALSMASFLDASVHMQVMLMLVLIAITLAVVPAVRLAQTVRAKLTRWRLALIALDLERTLDTHTHPAQLQQALATVLGDPTLRLAYPLDDGSYVDIDGRPVPADGAAPGRATTPVRRRGRVFAVIDHDEALHQQREVAEAAVAAAALAVENAHLHATQRAQIEQLRTSRLRLATAAFDERRRIQRDLHDGAQQRLFAVLILLDVARHHLDPGESDVAAATEAVRRAHSQLGDAIQTLRELTQGIYPEPLVDHGLATAVEALCELSPIPVSLDTPATRWPRHIEFTAYFVIAEALANVYKHARAGCATVAVRPHGDWLTVTIEDDGRGGATTARGSGLRRLQDRIAAVGGRLDITSSVEVGTRIVARLPVEPS